MIKPSDPRKLAEALLSRSTCRIQVAAVIADAFGIFSWGWNNPGRGFGEHAEAAAIRRANKARLDGSTIYVIGRRAERNKRVPAKPCLECMKLLKKWDLDIIYRDSDGEWKNG